MFRTTLPRGWHAVTQITCKLNQKFISLLEHPNKYQGRIIVYSPDVLHDKKAMAMLRAKMQSRQCDLALFATNQPCSAWLRTYLSLPKTPPRFQEYLIHADHLSPTKVLEEHYPVIEWPRPPT